jgi:hypothetical protein
VRTLPFQAKNGVQLLKDGLHDLTQPGQGAAQWLRPGSATGPPGPTNHLDAIVRQPVLVTRRSFKAGIDHIHPTDRLAATLQTRIRPSARGEERLRQELILSAGLREAKSSDHSTLSSRYEQMEALIPAEPIAPATIRLPSQPVPRRLASRVGTAALVPRLKGRIWAEQPLGQVQGKGDDRIALLAEQAIELRSGRQPRKSCPQVAPALPIESPLALETGPLPKEGQSHHLAPAQARRRARPGGFAGHLRLVRRHQSSRRVSRSWYPCPSSVSACTVEVVQANRKGRLPFFQV